MLTKIMPDGWDDYW